MLITCVSNFKAKRFTKKKRYSKSTNICICELSQLPTLPRLKRLKKIGGPWKFCHKITSMLSICFYMCAKFQVKKIYSEKYIQNLPTCVVVRDNFTIANFDTLPRIEFFCFCHEFIFKYHLYDDNMNTKFQIQKIHTKKDILNLPTCNQSW